MSRHVQSVYAGRSLEAIIRDFAVIRGDLSEEYARRQLRDAVLCSEEFGNLIAEAEERGAARVRERVEAVGGPPEDARMDAYYYGFDRTGIGAIDSVLSVLAYAGKAYHHTDDWQDDMSWDYGPIRKGETCADAIQRVANEAAESIRAAIGGDA